MQTTKTIFNIALVSLAVIACGIILAFIFYEYFGPKTMGVNNVGDQLAVDVVKAEDLTDAEKDELEERWFMEANYYSNDKGNGIKLQELNFNYFMTHNLTEADYRSTGMQYVGDFTGTMRDGKTMEYINNYVPTAFTYYDSTNGISFNGYNSTATNSVGTKLNRNAKLIIKIDSKPYVIQLTGTHTEVKYARNWYTLWLVNESYSVTYYHYYSSLFGAVFNAIESNSAGYGDYYITLDLSNYFSISAIDENGKIIEDNVTDVIKNYAVLKFHYDENGAKNSTQSMFGNIECNSEYDYEGVDFWAGRMVYTLTEEDVEYRYSEGYKGNFISISQKTKDMFKSMPKVTLKLDFNFVGKNVIGFDYLAFSGLNIDTLEITGVDSVKVLNNAFSGATLKTLRCAEELVFDGDFSIEYTREALTNEMV